MGIIKRQSIKKSMVGYVGVAIGAISTMLIYPLETKAYGLIGFLVAAAQLAFPIASFGAKLLAVRFFPDFKNPANGHNSFLGLLLTLVFTGFILFLGISYLFKDQVYLFYSDREALFLEFLPYAVGFTLLITLSEVLSAYISNFHRVVIPYIANNLFLKISLPIFILLIYFDKVSYAILVKAYLFIYFLIVVFLLAYLAYLKELKIRFNFKLIKKMQAQEMRSYAIYGILGSIGSILATQIDVVMVASKIDLSATGVYRLALFFATTIAIPMMAMMSISAPIVAKASKEKDYDQIDMLYKKTSIILFIAGAFIYCLIILNLDALLNMLPKGDVIRQGKYVIFILGAAKLFDLVTSINGYIINYSKYYRFSLYALLLLGVLNIILNQLFIPIFQINGVALATLVSIVLYNLIKLIYVYYRFRLLPFTKNTLYILIIGALGFFCAWIIPSSGYDIVDIFIKTAIFSSIFGGIILYSEIVPDINKLVKEGLDKVRNLF